MIQLHFWAQLAVRVLMVSYPDFWTVWSSRSPQSNDTKEPCSETLLLYISIHYLYKTHDQCVLYWSFSHFQPFTTMFRVSRNPCQFLNGPFNQLHRCAPIFRPQVIPSKLPPVFLPRLLISKMLQIIYNSHLCFCPPCFAPVPRMWQQEWFAYCHGSMVYLVSQE